MDYARFEKKYHTYYFRLHSDFPALEKAQKAMNYVYENAAAAAGGMKLTEEETNALFYKYAEFVDEVKKALKENPSFQPDKEFSELFNEVQNFSKRQMETDFKEMIKEQKNELDAAELYKKNDDIKKLGEELKQCGAPIDLERGIGTTAFYKMEPDGTLTDLFNSAGSYCVYPDKLTDALKEGTLVVFDDVTYDGNRRIFPRLVEAKNGNITLGKRIDQYTEQENVLAQKCTETIAKGSAMFSPYEKLNVARTRFEKELRERGFAFEEIRESNYNKILRDRQVYLDEGTLPLLREGKGKVYLRIANNESNMNKRLVAAEIDPETKRLTIGAPIEERYTEPKKPGFFKRLLHGINSSWFKTEFDRYHSEKAAYDESKHAFQVVEAREEAAKEIQKAKEAEETRKAKEAEEKVTEKVEEPEEIKEVEVTEEISTPEAKTDKEIVNSVQEKQQEILKKEGKTKIEDLSLDGRLELASHKMTMVGAKAMSLVGTMEFWVADNLYSKIGEIKQDLADNKPFDVENARLCMAKACLIDMISRGCSENPQQHESLATAVKNELTKVMEEHKKAGKESAVKPTPMEKKIMDSAAFQKYAENLTPDKLASFINNNEFAKLNQEMAKEKQTAKAKTEPQKDLQNEKKNDAPQMQKP